MIVVGKDSGSVYGMGFLGALFYFLQHATGFWPGLVGFFKAIFWPGAVVYGLLDYFKM